MKRSTGYTLAAGIVFLFACTSATYSQVDSMLNIYGEHFPQEKIYIHFDKPAYNTGETIWFKAYLQSGINPSLISRNFYAELLDQSGKILQRKLLPVFEATSAVSFDLPANVNTTTLVFRAYTTWMLNFDTAFLFNKTIRVLNKNSTVSK